MVFLGGLDEVLPNLACFFPVGVRRSKVSLEQIVCDVHGVFERPIFPRQFKPGVGAGIHQCLDQGRLRKQGSGERGLGVHVDRVDGLMSLGVGQQQWDQVRGKLGGRLEGQHAFVVGVGHIRAGVQERLGCGLGCLEIGLVELLHARVEAQHQQAQRLRGGFWGVVGITAGGGGVGAQGQEGGNPGLPLEQASRPMKRGPALVVAMRIGAVDEVGCLGVLLKQAHRVWHEVRAVEQHEGEESVAGGIHRGHVVLGRPAMGVQVRPEGFRVGGRAGLLEPWVGRSRGCSMLLEQLGGRGKGKHGGLISS